MTPAQYLDQALTLVESTSIREWANTAHNRPILETMAQGAIDKGSDPERFAAYLVCVAMGF